MDLTRKIQSAIGDSWPMTIKDIRASGAYLLDKIFTAGLASFFDARSKERRAEVFKAELQATLQNIKNIGENSIPWDFLETDECKDIIIDTLEEATNTKNRRKAKYFISAFVSGMVRQDIEIHKKMLFLNCLSNLSDAAIELLAKIYRLKRDLKINKHINSGTLQTMLEYKDIDFFVALLKELERFNLVHITWQSGTYEQQHSLLFVMDSLEEFCRYITEYSGEEIS